MEHTSNAALGFAQIAYFIGLAAFLLTCIYVFLRVDKLEERDTKPMVTVMVVHIIVMACHEAAMGTTMALGLGWELIALTMWAQAGHMWMKARALDKL